MDKYKQAAQDLGEEGPISGATAWLIVVAACCVSGAVLAWLGVMA